MYGGGKEYVADSGKQWKNARGLNGLREKGILGREGRGHEVKRRIKIWGGNNYRRVFMAIDVDIFIFP